MADPTVDDFRAYFPGAFPNVSDALLQRTINESTLLHNASLEATYYLIAHLLALQSEMSDEPDGGAGVVVKETIGPKTVDYSTLAGDFQSDSYNSFFATTGYGRMFLILERRTPRSTISAMVV